MFWMSERDAIQESSSISGNEEEINLIILSFNIKFKKKKWTKQTKHKQKKKKRKKTLCEGNVKKIRK